MFENCFDRLRQRSALVHNTTNYVTVNDVANIILACGASPIMADEPEEAAEITAICTGLMINMGASSQRNCFADCAARQTGQSAEPPGSSAPGRCRRQHASHGYRTQNCG